MSWGAQGAQGHLLGRPAPVPDDTPSYQEAVAMLAELTLGRERKRVSAALQRSDALYRVLVRTLPDTIVSLLDLDLRFQLVEGPAFESLGWDRSELEGRTVFEAFPPDRAGAFAALLRPVFAGGIVDLEWPTIRGGKLLLVHAAPVEDEQVGVIGVMLICWTAQGRGVDAALRDTRGAPRGTPLGLH